jgi:hypothetical protein
MRRNRSCPFTSVPFRLPVSRARYKRGPVRNLEKYQESLTDRATDTVCEPTLAFSPIPTNSTRATRHGGAA